MNEITINQEGAILYHRQPVTSNPLKFLNYQIELAEDFTLRGYFAMLSRYPLLAEINEFFPTILEQYAECPANGCVWDSAEYLEFGKTVELIGFPNEPRLEIYNDLKGIQEEKSTEIRSVLLDNLVDISIRLGDLKHIVFGDKVDVFRFETVFTLFEFIDGITWELSFQPATNACSIRR